MARRPSQPRVVDAKPARTPANIAVGVLVALSALGSTGSGILSWVQSKSTENVERGQSSVEKRLNEELPKITEKLNSVVDNLTSTRQELNSTVQTEVRPLAKTVISLEAKLEASNQIQTAQVNELRQKLEDLKKQISDKGPD